MIHKTERLILRPWHEDDAEELYKYASDPDVGPSCWMATAYECGEQPRNHSYGAIRDGNLRCLPEENGNPIGNVGFHRNDLVEKDDEYELGYWVGKPFLGARTYSRNLT